MMMRERENWEHQQNFSSHFLHHWHAKHLSVWVVVSSSLVKSVWRRRDCEWVRHCLEITSNFTSLAADNSRLVFSVLCLVLCCIAVASRECQHLKTVRCVCWSEAVAAAASEVETSSSAFNWNVCLFANTENTSLNTASKECGPHTALTAAAALDDWHLLPLPDVWVCVFAFQVDSEWWGWR